MVDIISFKGILYNKEEIPDLRTVITPPYDVITKEGQKDFYERSENNIIRLDLGMVHEDDDENNNRYTRAATYLKKWMATGILKQESIPSIYLYELDYTLKSGEKKVLKGFFTLVKLEELGKGKIIPHEDTFSSVKEDRLKLLRACRTNFSPIFSIYSDSGSNIINMLKLSSDQNSPIIDITNEDGIGHKLWAIRDSTTITRVINEMKDKTLLIADGHHRYETAMNFRNEIREILNQGQEVPAYKVHQQFDGFEYVMMFLSDMDDPGLTILPTHRLIKSFSGSQDILKLLEEYFKIEQYEFNEDDEVRKRFFQRMRDAGRENTTFGLYMKGRSPYYLLILKDINLIKKWFEGDKSMVWNRLDVSIFQNIIVERILGIDDISKESKIIYLKDDCEAAEKIKKGEGELAFFLNPPKIEEMKEIVEAGERMPHKSTYFYPKPLTGLVINKL